MTARTSHAPADAHATAPALGQSVAVRMLVPLRDDELLVLSGQGDTVAFAQLYDRIAGQVFGVARRVVRDPAMAEEIAQEVLLEVWAKADRFDPARGTAGAWITTLAHRRAVDRVRSEQAARVREDRVGRRDQQRAFDEVLEQVETRADHGQVRAAVATLSAPQREAVLLAYFEGHTYREVATILGIPEGTAKSRLRDALTRLRAALSVAA